MNGSLRRGSIIDVLDDLIDYLPSSPVPRISLDLGFQPLAHLTLELAIIHPFWFSIAVEAR
jgi:hypothetical protein